MQSLTSNDQPNEHGSLARRGMPKRPPRTRWAVELAVLLGLLLALGELPQRLGSARAALPILQHWPDAAAQGRQLVGTQLYDTLMVADQRLPPEASILLLTAGEDVRHKEYVAFHRALYYLAPRQVWWAAPAPRDDTWEARWWEPTALRPAAIAQRAAAVQASHVLALGVPREVVPGQWVGDLSAQAQLFELRAVGSGRHGASHPITLDAGWSLRLFAALGLILIIGNLLLAYLADPEQQLTGLERFALAWLLGAGASSLALLWLSWLGLSLSRTPGVLASLTAAALLLHYWRGRGRAWLSQRRTSARALLQERLRSCHQIVTPAEGGARGAARAGQILLLFLLAWGILELALLAVVALGQPLRVWDSWVTWGMRARLIYLADGVHASLYSDASRTVTHLNYPLLVPLVEAWLYTWLGAPDDRFAGLQALLFLLALLATTFRALCARGPARYALAVVLILLTLRHIGGLAALVFADIPLAAYATAAALRLQAWLQHGRRGDLLLAAVLAGLLAWTKLEGTLLLAVLGCACVLAARARPPAWRACLAMTLAALALSGPWYGLLLIQDVPQPMFQPLTPETLRAGAPRLPQILSVLADRALQPEWRGLWVILGPGLLLGLRSGRRPAYPVLAIAPIIYLAASAGLYLFSDYRPLEAHVLRSADRLMAHVAPMALLALAAQWREQNS